MKFFGVLVFILVAIVTPAVYAEGAIGPTERLQELQQNRGVVVTPEQRDSVSKQCNENKPQLLTLRDAEDAAVRKRLTVYSTIQKEVKAIELRMSKQGADASEIDLFIGKLQQDLDAFTEQARYSEQLAEDIATIDCSATPEYYQAAVEEYAENREKLLATATELRSMVQDAPNTTFSPLIDRLRI